MGDVVKVLRETVCEHECKCSVCKAIVLEAADTIESLEAKLDAAQKICKDQKLEPRFGRHDADDQARADLAEIILETLTDE
jgi:hypothetical protein